MRKILLCIRRPHNNSYVGGVATILNSYLDHKEIFWEFKYDVNIFDYQAPEKWDKYNSKMRNIVYIFQQRKAMTKNLKVDSDLILSIHTSREFLFVKDVFLAVMAAKKFSVPVVLTIHVGDINTVFNRIIFLDKIIIKLMNKYIKKTVFLSDQICRQFIERGLNEEQCEVLYNFHNMKSIDKVDMLPRTSKLQLLFVGAIHREKGILELLAALNDISDVDFHLDICGKITDKSIENEFDNYIKKLGDKVTLCGYVYGKQKTSLFKRADILVLPSYREGLPLVILEALVSECAIISTPVGATPEILNDENVIWTKVGSSEDIKNAITLLSKNPDKLVKIQKANLGLSYDYTIKKHIKKLCLIYDNI